MKPTPKSPKKSPPVEQYYAIMDGDTLFGPLPIEDLLTDLRNSYGDRATDQAEIFPKSAAKKVKLTIELI